MKFDKDYLEKVKQKIILPPSGYKISDDGTELVAKTEDEILANNINTPEGFGERVNYLTLKISEGKKYLADTDYIVSKFAELQLTEDVQAHIDMTTKYQEQLQQRKMWRDNINRYETLLTELQSLPVVLPKI